MAIAWNSSHSYKHSKTKPFSRYKLLATLQDPFPNDVPLVKAGQKACYNSLCFWIRWYVCWSDILRASELDNGQQKPCWWHTPTMSRFWDVIRRHSTNWESPIDLRKGNGCSFEHPKIQSYGGKLVGQIDEHPGHLMLLGSNHTGFQIQEYSSPFSECHFVQGDKESQSPGERRVQ